MNEKPQLMPQADSCRGYNKMRIEYPLVIGCHGQPRFNIYQRAMASQPLVTGGKIIVLVKSLFSTSGAYPRILKAHLALLAKWTISIPGVFNKAILNGERVPGFAKMHHFLRPVWRSTP